jgi:glycosyltransferase involved in cell wall biosynthesis
VHLISDSGHHPYFRALVKESSYPADHFWVGSVGAPGRLQADMRAIGAGTFALGAPRRRAYPVATARLARLLRNLKPALLQTHLVDGALVGLPAAHLAGVPSIFTAHHSSELPFHGRKLVWFDTASARFLSDRVIAPSRQAAEVLARFTATPASKIDIVHLGLDLGRFDPLRATPARIRAELRLENAVVFGAVGRLFHVKNYEALVTAFAILRDRLPEAVLAIVGQGDQAPLRAVAVEAGVADQLLLLGPRDDIPDFLAACDVFVHPSLAETFGQVIIEAMAMALPIVSTAIGIAPEVVQTGVTGVLVEDTDIESLATALEQIVDLRPRWSALGEEGRRRAQAFTLAAMTSGYERVYASVLASREKTIRF